MNPETPFIQLDSSCISRNISAMQREADKYGVNLRPHIKTHKSIDLAKLQVQAGAYGITASKLSEVETFAAGGINNIFMAYPLIGSGKIRNAVALSKKTDLICSVDCLEGARLISQEALRQETTVSLRLEIDTGLHRTGISYGKAVETALSIDALDGIYLEGIFTFRGLLMSTGATLDGEKAGREEGEMMVSLARDIRNKGLILPSVSVGSTPTSLGAAAVKGVTEIRPGTYIFNDRMGLNGGFCNSDQIGAVIKTSIVSVSEGCHMVIDAGSKTLAADQPLNVPPFHFQGHGHIVEAPELTISRLSEEHGMIHFPDGYTVSWKPGDRLTVIPNHICTCVNLQDSLFLCERDGSFTRVKVDARGKVY